jgi:hypothetical protein
VHGEGVEANLINASSLSSAVIKGAAPKVKNYLNGLIAGNKSIQEKFKVNAVEAHSLAAKVAMANKSGLNQYNVYVVRSPGALSDRIAATPAPNSGNPTSGSEAGVLGTSRTSRELPSSPSATGGPEITGHAAFVFSGKIEDALAAGKITEGQASQRVAETAVHEILHNLGFDVTDPEHGDKSGQNVEGSGGAIDGPPQKLRLGADTKKKLQNEIQRVESAQ